VVDLGQPVPVALGDHGEARRDQPDAVAQLRPGEPPVLAGEDGAEPRRRELQLRVLGPVLRQHRDPVAAPDAPGREGAGEAVRALAERGVGQGASAALQGDGAAVSGDLLPEQGADRQAGGLRRQRGEAGLAPPQTIPGMRPMRHARFLSLPRPPAGRRAEPNSLSPPEGTSPPRQSPGALGQGFART
jgi:hypothetical protein